MTKYQLIDALENKQIQTPDGLWHKVTGGQFVTKFGVVRLNNHTVEMLEAFYQTAHEGKE